MFWNIFLGLLLWILVVSAQVTQCPNTFPEECSCRGYGYGPEILCVTLTMDTWDIKTTFDAISDAFNNTEAVTLSVHIDSKLVTNPAQEVPAHTVSTLKIQHLSFSADHKYTRIDPDAFSGTYSTTVELNFYGMDFQDAVEAFDLISNFPLIRQLAIAGGSTLNQIPAHAFDKDLQSLEYVFITNAGLQSIGYLPFVDVPNYTKIHLDGNNLTLANLSDEAFTFSNTRITLNLERNPGITHLPEEKFGKFLREDENTIYVGCDFCNPPYQLQCDDRIDWICDAGVTRIYGYKCLEAGYDDIHDYCRQKKTVHFVENLEGVKRFNWMIVSDTKKDSMEEEFRRSSYNISKAKRQNQIHT